MSIMNNNTSSINNRSTSNLKKQLNLSNSNAHFKKPIEQELDDVRQKFLAMESERKSFFTQAQIARQRNKDIIEALQKENRELKDQIKLKVCYLICPFLFNHTDLLFY